MNVSALEKNKYTRVIKSYDLNTLGFRKNFFFIKVYVRIK